MEITGSQVLTAALAGAIALLFIGLSAFFLGRGVLLKFRAKSASIFAGRPAEFVLFIHAVALTIIIGFIYSAVFEPSQLMTKRYNLENSRLTSSIDICFVSDLKWPRCGLSLDEIVQSINIAEPDLVLFGGDMVIDENFDEAAEAFSKINCPRRIGCTGNFLPQADLDFYKLAGIQALFSKGIFMNINDQRIYLYGVESSGESNPTIKGSHEGVFSILLAHSPELIPIVNSFGFDLYLCGHTLGGQVRLPFLKNLFVPGEWGKIYPYGQFRVGDMDALVTKGLGMSRNAPKMRLFCHPEILKITAIPKGDANEPEDPDETPVNTESPR